MTRIITPELNKKLKKEYTLRFLIVISFSVCIVFFIHAMFALSSYMLLSSYEKLYQHNLIKNDTDILKQNEAYLNTLNQLALISKEIPTENVFSSIDVLETIKQYANSGISLKTFEMYKEKDKTKITLRGIAQTREDLRDFDKKMKTNKNFVDFNIPINTLTKQNDINFDITFIYYEN